MKSENKLFTMHVCIYLYIILQKCVHDIIIIQIYASYSMQTVIYACGKIGETFLSEVTTFTNFQRHILPVMCDVIAVSTNS